PRGHAPAGYRGPARSPTHVRGADPVVGHGLGRPTVAQVGRRSQPRGGFALGAAAGDADRGDAADGASIPFPPDGPADGGRRTRSHSGVPTRYAGEATPG